MLPITKTFSPEEIHDQVKKILDFPVFRNSPTLTRFLEFIISETIKDRNQQIKEYSIAVNVLGRPTDFNPHDDAVVRIHAGRLRRALNEYYYTSGISDALIIHIPKGCYIPQFQKSDADHPSEKIIPVPIAQKATHPVIAIFPIKTMSVRPDINEFSFILGEQLSAELSRFQDISVIGYFSTEMISKIRENILEAGKSVRADYILTGSIQQENNNIRVRINFIITSTGEVGMTKSYEKDITRFSSFEFQDEIVRNVIGAVITHDGLILSEFAPTSPL